MTLPTSADTEQDWLAGNTYSGRIPGDRFEIVLDRDTIVLQGTRDEAENETLSGRCVVHLQQSLHGQMKLRLARKVRHRQSVPAAGDPYSHSYNLYDFVDETEVLEDVALSSFCLWPAGRHEKHFSFTIPADTPPTLEGPMFTYVIYRLKCTLERPRFHKDLVAKKHIRIHRTMGADSLLLQMPVSVDSHWPDKCAYRVEMAQSGVIYGTRIPVDFKIAPLKKGVRPIRSRMLLDQTVVAKPDHPTRCLQAREQTKTVLEETKDVDDENLEQNEEGWWVWQQVINLPCELTRLTQTYREPSLPSLRVKHLLRYRIGLRNPEGHISEVQGELDVKLYFTRHMQIGDRAVTGLPHTASDEERGFDNPPTYENAALDELFSGIDITGFATPIGPRSGPGTPQRNRSANSLQALLEGREEDDEQHGARDGDEERNSADEEDSSAHEVHANTLRNRLDEVMNPLSASSNRHNLTNHVRPRESHLPRNRSFQGAAQSPLAGPVRTPAQEDEDPMEAADVAMRRAGFQHSHETGSAQRTRQNSPVHLSRVPSYDTALRTPAPTGPPGAQHGTGDNAPLPTYEDASRQNSVDSNSTGPATVPHSGTSTPSKRGGVLSSLFRR